MDVPIETTLEFAIAAPSPSAVLLATVEFEIVKEPSFAKAPPSPPDRLPETLVPSTVVTALEVARSPPPSPDETLAINDPPEMTT